MLSTQYRKRLEFVCERIVNRSPVQLSDMIWAEKLAKANRSAAELLRRARRKAANPDMVEGSLDDFMNQMDLGDPDPSSPHPIHVPDHAAGTARRVCDRQRANRDKSQRPVRLRRYGATRSTRFRSRGERGRRLQGADCP